MEFLNLSPIIFAGMLSATVLFAAAVVYGDRRAVKAEYRRRLPRNR